MLEPKKEKIPPMRDPRIDDPRFEPYDEPEDSQELAIPMPSLELQEDPDDSIGNRVDRPLTPNGRHMVGRMESRSRMRNAVMDRLYQKGMQAEDPLAANMAFSTFAKLDGNEIKAIEVESQLLGLYDPVPATNGGRTMLLSFDGGTVNVQVNNK